MADRWGRLAIIAHREGALDFSRARRYDYRWALQENWIFDVLEDELAVRVNSLSHLWHCSAAQLTEWDEKETKFEYHRKEANRVFRDVGKLLLPWYKRWLRADEKPLEQLWKEFKEQEKDPVYAAALQEAKKELGDRIRKGKEVAETLEAVSKARREAAKQQEVLAAKRAARRKQQHAKLRN